MSANYDVHHIEARQGFADQGGGQDAGRSGSRALPWQALLDALAAGDVELARHRYRELLADHPEWRVAPLTEIGSLISSANHRAALARLRALRSPAYLMAAPEAAAPHRPAVTIRSGSDVPEVVGLKLDLSA
jgi:hypothetical protein